MRKAWILLILSIWVAVLPYLGFPSSLKNILFTISGLGLAYFSYLLYREAKAKDGNVKTFDNFSENHNFNIDENHNGGGNNENEEDESIPEPAELENKEI